MKKHVEKIKRGDVFIVPENWGLTRPLPWSGKRAAVIDVTVSSFKNCDVFPAETWRHVTVLYIVLPEDAANLKPGQTVFQQVIRFNATATTPTVSVTENLTPTASWPQRPKWVKAR